LGEGSHGSVLSENYAPNRLSSGCKSTTIALGLKAVFLVTTILGLTGLWIAIMADTGATVLVTLNALRMLRFDPEMRKR
jgi:hypothetical protein